MSPEGEKEEEEEKSLLVACGGWVGEVGGWVGVGVSRNGTQSRCWLFV